MSDRVRNYRDLVVWQRAMDLVEAVYRATKTWPQSEVYGLISQTQRAAVSIPANIAEGQGRGGDREFLRLLAIAHGSLRELETHIMIGERLGYLSSKNACLLLEHANNVGRLIQCPLRRLRLSAESP
jgi:four helix bundle protein